ncbi:MAG: hypothetical protein U9R40_05575 [Synergistota bacterium]|nr:hypothetical protein [Synergistota bacterium]
MLALVTGSLFALEQSLQVMRVRDIRIDSLALVPDSVILNAMDDREKRFWPLFWMHRETLIETITADLPVEIRAGMVEPGVFSFKVTPLQPWILVFWNGSEWFLSRSGRFWSVHHDKNHIIYPQTVQAGAVVVWEERVPVSILEPGKAAESVFQASLPMETIERWKSGLFAEPWYGLLSTITVTQREGKRVLDFLLRMDERNMSIVFPDNTSLWPHLFEALEKIFQSVESSGRDVFIDATYSSRILVRTKQRR